MAGTARIVILLLTIKSAQIASEEEEDLPQLPEPVYIKYASRVFYALAKTRWNNLTRPYLVEQRKDPKADLNDEDIKVLVDMFETVMSEETNNNTQNELNYIKKREIDQIRKTIIPRKKYLKKNFKEPDHINFSRIKFLGEDLTMLLKAIMAHRAKWRNLRDNNYKVFEMEKKFHEKQVLRHTNNDGERKKELERLEKEKAARANIDMKHPLSEDQVKEVWREEDQLPEEEYDPKTFFNLHDLDGNGFLDSKEIDTVLEFEFKKAYDTQVPGNDREARREEMLRMREHIYSTVDVNKDSLIDLDEFLTGIAQEKETKWESHDNDVEYDDEEFEQFEKQRIDEIRDQFARGEKPRKYEFDDVPLLDDNFVNETHVKMGDTLIKADDRSHDEREEEFKKHEMKKRFEREQMIYHAKDEEERKRLESQIGEDHQLYMNHPLSKQQILNVWEVQDHKNISEFNESSFFHLHDINTDGVLDSQELRLMLVTEINQGYKNRNKTIDLEELSEELERMREKVLDEGDQNKDGKLDFKEFTSSVERVQKKEEEEKRTNMNRDKYWVNLEEKSAFSEEEYRNFREEEILQIRKLISEGKMPENYNYTDVPQLTGNFLNSTHIMKNGVLINLHQQTDMLRYQDFKKYLMQHRYFVEEELHKIISPEEKELVLKNLHQRREMRRRNVETSNVALSEKQEKEVWENEDHMNETFNVLKYFRLHDTDRDGLWSKEEIVASLIGELNRIYDVNNPSLQEERNAKMAEWLKHVFENGDRNKDFHIDKDEFAYLAQLGKEAEEKFKEKEKEEVDYSEAEFEKFKVDQEQAH